MNRDERSRLESTFPKCACGNTIGKQRSADGKEECSRCENNRETADEERKDMEFLRELRLAHERRQ